MSRYYKILPENLICRDFQYQEGLNIDTNTIDEDECSYGLHFADAEHILSFYNYGFVIAEVEIPEDAIMYHFDDKSKADRVILKNIRPLWSAETLNALVQEGVNLGPCKNDVLRRAALNGYLGVVKYLIEQGANIHAMDDFALCLASKNGHLDIVKYLVEHGANIHAGDDDALYLASTNGHFDIVKYLVEQGADIHACNDSALRWASTYGYFNIVKYLVEQGADIHARDDEAIQYAGTLKIKKYLKSLK